MNPLQALQAEVPAVDLPAVRAAAARGAPPEGQRDPGEGEGGQPGGEAGGGRRRRGGHLEEEAEKDGEEPQPQVPPRQGKLQDLRQLPQPGRTGTIFEAVDLFIF